MATTPAKTPQAPAHFLNAYSTGKNDATVSNKSLMGTLIKAIAANTAPAAAAA